MAAPLGLARKGVCVRIVTNTRFQAVLTNCIPPSYMMVQRAASYPFSVDLFTIQENPPPTYSIVLVISL